MVIFLFMRSTTEMTEQPKVAFFVVATVVISNAHLINWALTTKEAMKTALGRLLPSVTIRELFT